MGTRLPEHLSAPIVGIAGTTDGGGYWLVDEMAVYSRWAIHVLRLGSKLASQCTGGRIAATSDYGGYYLVAADGGVFAFGDAVYRGQWVENL